MIKNTFTESGLKEKKYNEALFSMEQAEIFREDEKYIREYCLLAKKQKQEKMTNAE